MFVHSKANLTIFNHIFHLALHACDHRHSWVIFTNSVVSLVVRDCREDEHDVVELKAKRAVELVHHKT